MNEQNDISEARVGDKVVDGYKDIHTVIEIIDGEIRCEDENKFVLYYLIESGEQIRSPGSKSGPIRPASADDIARHTKKQLSSWLNNVKWMDKSIEHLERIKAAAEAVGS